MLVEEVEVFFLELDLMVDLEEEVKVVMDLQEEAQHQERQILAAAVAAVV
jgi:hypothetical protein